ncbi:fluoride efflux transporter FluC [Lacisediminihabitans sp.]|uniref:fluoride efflux transporter FluC n=1 Tax=Lacisediminihabitans sp. TaxID=2787631 RepID=UPI00374CF28F
MTGRAHDGREGARPIHLRWRYLGLVAVGGAVGTALREALGLLLPPVGGIDVAVLGINVVGAFALGVLLEHLARRGTDEGGRRTARLLLGTGLLGGFTTYSALAADTSLLFAVDRAWPALAYGLGSVLIGALAAWAGITVSAAAGRPRRSTGDGE